MTCREQWPEEPQRWCGGCLYLGSGHHAEVMPIPTPERFDPHFDANYEYCGLHPEPEGKWVKWSEVEALLLQRAQEIADLCEENVALRDNNKAVKALFDGRAQEIEQVKAEVRRWAIYCFQKHGNDAHLYNGLADLAGMNPEAVNAALVSRAPQPVINPRRCKHGHDHATPEGAAACQHGQNAWGTELSRAPQPEP